MELTDRPDARFAIDPTGRDGPPAALADAGDIVERAAADQAAADEARLRFRRDGLPTLQPDKRIAPLLEPGERLVAVRHDALLDRREPAPGERVAPGVAGELYVTSRRLVLVGRLAITVPLDAIADVVVSGGRLLLVLRDGHGVALQVAGPRLLWAEIAAARASAKAVEAVETAVPAGSGAGQPPAAR